LVKDPQVSRPERKIEIDAALDYGRHGMLVGRMGELISKVGVCDELGDGRAEICFVGSALIALEPTRCFQIE
jgi:hypothetical protein